MSQTAKSSGIVENEGFPLENFYRPSENLTSRICDRIDFLEAEATKEIEVRERSDLEDANSDDSDEPYQSATYTGPEIAIQQRLIAEELDGCLINSADTQAAIHGEKINIHQVVTEGMSDALGLDNGDPLLGELASEFQSWLDSIGSYTAGWGEIISTNDGHMYLHMFAIDEEQIVEPDYTFTRSYESKQKPGGGLLKRLAARFSLF